MGETVQSLYTVHCTLHTVQLPHTLQTMRFALKTLHRPLCTLRAHCAPWKSEKYSLSCANCNVHIAHCCTEHSCTYCAWHSAHHALHENEQCAKCPAACSCLQPLPQCTPEKGYETWLGTPVW